MMDYRTENIETIHKHKAMICNKCGGKIFESGGDSFGYKYFKCGCSEWKSKDSGGWAFAKFNGGDIIRQC